MADGGPHDPALRRHVPERGTVALVEGPIFRLDRLDGSPDAAVIARYTGGPLLVVPLDGEVRVAGEIIAPGACAVAARLDALAMADGARCLIAQPLERAG